MTNQLISEDVNIDLYPTSIPVKEDKQIAIGDLHGNAVKLLYFLVRHGIAECEDSQYQRFVEIYRKPVNLLTDADLSEIKNICKQLTIKNKPKICLIGDELADRGQNDYFTLLLLNKLHEKSVPVDILLSNHGYTFTESLETNQPFRSSHMWGTRTYASSMHNLQDLIDGGKLNRDEIRSLAEDSYLPNLKLLSYTIDNDNEITLYSHARIDEEVIVNLAEKMGVPYKANTARELAETIESINRIFQQKYVANKLINTMPKNLNSEKKDDPITFLMWNRDYNVLQKKPHSYKMNIVHGHDSNGPKEEGVYCLNNALGYNLNMHTGQYQVLVSSLDHQKEQTNQLPTSLIAGKKSDPLNNPTVKIDSNLKVCFKSNPNEVSTKGGTATVYTERGIVNLRSLVGTAPTTADTQFFKSSQKRRNIPERSKDSSLTHNQYKEARTLIEKLVEEVDSRWPYPNKARKKEKINTLIDIIDRTNEGRKPSVIIEEIKTTNDKIYQEAVKGSFSTRTADLFETLVLEEKTMFSLTVT